MQGLSKLVVRVEACDLIFIFVRHELVGCARRRPYEALAALQWPRSIAHGLHEGSVARGIALVPIALQRLCSPFDKAIGIERGGLAARCFLQGLRTSGAEGFQVRLDRSSVELDGLLEGSERQWDMTALPGKPQHEDVRRDGIAHDVCRETAGRKHPQQGTGDLRSRSSRGTCGTARSRRI